MPVVILSLHARYKWLITLCFLVNHCTSWIGVLPAGSRQRAASRALGEKKTKDAEMERIHTSLTIPLSTLPKKIITCVTTDEMTNAVRAFVDSGHVVAEIGSLSSELQTLRSQVLEAKTRLLEASSELKSAHERKT